MKVTLTDNNREIDIVLPTTDRTLRAELYTLRLADYSKINENNEKKA